MSELVLACEGLTKEYGGKAALQDVTLQLRTGRIYGLIGRNGAGKTTLLSLLAGQAYPTRGSVALGGGPVWENQQALDQICFSRELAPAGSLGSFRVKEYLRMARIYYPHWDEEYANRLLGQFGLEQKKRISRLSRGMLSMVTILVALASKAPLTFLDEPVAGLDVVARERFYQLLLEEYAATGRGFVLSTHILEEAAGLFEEVILLDRGQVLLREGTESLTSRFFAISGLDSQVEAACAGLQVHHTRQLGRSRAVWVSVPPGQQRPALQDKGLDIEPLGLQQIFVALCGAEEGEGV